MQKSVFVNTCSAAFYGNYGQLPSIWLCIQMDICSGKTGRLVQRQVIAGGCRGGMRL